MATEILSSYLNKSQVPFDAKLYAKILTELANLGTNSNKAFTYYEDMEVICVENHTTYVWREELTLNETGGILENGTYIYPVGVVANGIDYGSRKFNFFPKILTNTEVPELNNKVETTVYNTAISAINTELGTKQPNITNSIDIKTIGSELQFNDRAKTSNSLGYKYIRSNFDFTTIPDGYDNSIWEIRDSFDLEGATITLSEKSELLFNGGKISNCTLVGNKTKLPLSNKQIFGNNVDFSGTWDVDTISPKMFGAVGDGVTNDTLAFQKAIDFAAAYIDNLEQDYNFRCTVTVPSGVYPITSLLMKKGVHLRGEDQFTTTLLKIPNNSVVAFIDTLDTTADAPDAAENNRYLAISNLSIRGVVDEEGVPTENTIGIRLYESNYESYLDRVTVCNFKDNLYCEDSFTIRITNSHIFGASRRNLWLKNFTASTIDKCRIDKAGETNIYLESSDAFPSHAGINILNSSIQQSQGSAIYFGNTVTARLSGNFIEGNCKDSNVSANIILIEGINIQLTSQDNYINPAGLTDADITVFKFNAGMSFISINDRIDDGSLEGLDLSSVSGTFQVGETITGGTSGVTATIHSIDSTKIYFVENSGSFQDTESVVGSNSSASGTVDDTIEKDYYKIGIDSTASALKDFIIIGSRIDCETPYTLNSGCKLVDIERDRGNIVTYDNKGNFRIPFVDNPATFTNTSPGDKGAIRVGEDYIYVAVNNVGAKWKRIPIPLTLKNDPTEIPIGDISYEGIKHKAVLFANLPASPNEGTVCYITDANTISYRATAVGGGSGKALVMYDGINWIYH